MKSNMAEIIYKTDYETSPPFLIDQNQFKRLDEIVKNEWPNLLEYKSSTIKKTSLEEFQSKLTRGWYKDCPQADLDTKLQEIEKETRESYTFRHEETIITLQFKDGNSIRVSSFSEAFRNRDINDKNIVGFGLDLDCGEVKLNLKCYPYKLSLDVRPQDRSVSSELFLQFKRGIDTVRAPVWQRIVIILGHSHWILMFYILMILLIFGITKKTPDWPQIEQAHKLLQNGIDEDEHRVALETILALESEFGKPKRILVIASWYRLVAPIGIIVCILLSLIPKVVFDIGKDEGKVRYWRFYLHFISVTIPVAVFSSFVWPYIQNLLISTVSH
jgi:hypothetical protein